MKPKMKHIAVVLRGHVRTWHFNAPKVFEFYNEIAENVDYYFITWDTSNTDGIEETFKDQNLVHFQIVSHTLENALLSKGEEYGRWYNGHLGPAYMNTLILPHLRRREKQLGNKYNCVFDTRPDVLAVRSIQIWGDHTGEPFEVTLPEPNSIYITGLELQENLCNISPMSGKQDIAIQDWFMYMGSDEFEIFNMRYHEDHYIYVAGDGPGTQIEIREYIADKKMFLCVQDWCKAYMMRPCVFRLDWLDSRDTQKMLYANRRWPSMTKESKILDCERYDISLSDYVDTPSITCKI
jgi:hypothetical protein